MTRTENERKKIQILAGLGLTITLAICGLATLAQTLEERYLLVLSRGGIGFGERDDQIPKQTQGAVLRHEAATMSAKNVGWGCKGVSMTINGQVEDVGIACGTPVDVYIKLFRQYLLELTN